MEKKFLDIEMKVGEWKLKLDLNKKDNLKWEYIYNPPKGA